MTADYSADISLAQDLIRSSGSLFTIRRAVKGTYDPVLDTETGSVVLTYLVEGVFLPLFQRPELRDRYFVIGSGLISDHSRLLIPARLPAGGLLPFEPGPSDQVILGTAPTPNTQWWKIDSVANLRPSLDPIFHTLLLTRGMGDLWEPSFS
jgi:hypothetical protein